MQGNIIYVGLCVQLVNNIDGHKVSICANSGCANFDCQLVTAYCPYCGIKVSFKTIPLDESINSIITDMSGNDTPLFRFVNDKYIIGEGPWNGGYWLPSNAAWDISSLFTTDAVSDRYPEWIKLMSMLDSIGIATKLTRMCIPVNSN